MAEYNGDSTTQEISLARKGEKDELTGVYVVKYSIMIPCYNEEENLLQLIQRMTPLCEAYDMECILIENGSRDNSRAVIMEAEKNIPWLKGVYVDVNQGYGYGLQQGLKAASGEYAGWIHADMQIPPEELARFFGEADRLTGEKVFLKGRRKNRSSFDRFFTNGQSLFNSLLFGRKIYDVGAIPVLFDRALLDTFCIDDMPNDFSIELFIYLQALLQEYRIERRTVELLARERGSSSWNTGLRAKIRQSKRIFRDSIQIKKGEKVL